jgi:uracil-DNA glycosylase family 4
MSEDNSNCSDSFELLEADIIDCRLCPRLVSWREQVAREKRASYRDEEYWGRPIPGFGDRSARIVFLGLAPAAHGANRTGRVFTGDRSGDWLFRALYRAGLANQEASVSIDDGLELTDAWVLAAVRCAPPANKPTTAERDSCEPFLRREFSLLVNCSVVVCLGAFGYQAACRYFDISPRPAFGHGVVLPATECHPALVCSFHPSQQNTFTGRLTEQMFDDVIATATAIADNLTSS